MPTEDKPPTNDQSSIQAHFVTALLGADRIAAETIKDELSRDMLPLEFAEGILVPALEEIGSLWDKGEVALSQVFMSGRISERLLDSLLSSGPDSSTRQFPIGIAVLADQHVLGKRIVHSILRSAGYDPIDFGAGISAEKLAEKVVSEGVRVLLVSTLMLPSALRVKELCRLLENQDVKVIVGGAPFLFDKDLWREVGADGMGRNAADAISLVQKFEEEMA